MQNFAVLLKEVLVDSFYLGARGRELTSGDHPITAQSDLILRGEPCLKEEI